MRLLRACDDRLAHCVNVRLGLRDCCWTAAVTFVRVVYGTRAFQVLHKSPDGLVVGPITWMEFKLTNDSAADCDI